jgi:hypothetical protein
VISSLTRKIFKKELVKVRTLTPKEKALRRGVVKVVDGDFASGHYTLQGVDAKSRQEYTDPGLEAICNRILKKADVLLVCACEVYEREELTESTCISVYRFTRPDLEKDQGLRALLYGRKKQRGRFKATLTQTNGLKKWYAEKLISIIRLGKVLEIDRPGTIGDLIEYVIPGYSKGTRTQDLQGIDVIAENGETAQIKTSLLTWGSGSVTNGSIF